MGFIIPQCLFMMLLLVSVSAARPLLASTGTTCKVEKTRRITKSDVDALWASSGMWKQSTPLIRVHVIGNDLAGFRRKTLAQCMQECDKLGACKAITYALQNHPAYSPDCDPEDNCWLKSDTGPTAIASEAHDRINMVTFVKPA